MSTLPSVTSRTCSGRAPVAPSAPRWVRAKACGGSCRRTPPGLTAGRHPPGGLGGDWLRGLAALRAGGRPWWEGQGWQRSGGVPGQVLPRGRQQSLMLVGQREDPDGARQLQGPCGGVSSPRQLLPTSVSPERVFAASCLARCSPRPASGFDPGSFQITASVLGLREREMLYASFQKRVSVSYRHQALLYAGYQPKPHRLQNQPSLQAPRAREMRVGRDALPADGPPAWGCGPCLYHLSAFPFHLTGSPHIFSRGKTLSDGLQPVFIGSCSENCFQ